MTESAPAFGRPRRHFRVTDSTNARARALAERGAPSGTVVTADEQEAGRGRRGRRWSAPAGKALLLSAILRPLDAGHRLLPLSVPLAVCRAIESLAPARCQVKWPNDLWIDGRKVAGVLIEARPPDWAVIGIGINLSIEQDFFPADLRWPATSVGHGATPEAALATVNDRLAAWVTAPPDEVLAEFRSRDALRGREVRWSGSGGPDGRGIAEGIDESGDLLVRDGSGRLQRLGSGEVELILGPNQS